MNWINVGLEMTNTGKAKTKCKKVLIGPKIVLTVKNSDIFQHINSIFSKLERHWLRLKYYIQKIWGLQ